MDYDVRETSMKEKILIVDDSEFNRDLLGEILHSKYDIIEAANGVEALNIISENKEEIVAILLDLVMPEMDGFAFMDKLNKVEDLTLHVPILVISGDVNFKNEKKCLEMGVNDFIGKPFNAMLVQRRVENAVSRYIYRHKLEETVDAQLEELRRSYKTVKKQAKRLEARNREIIEMMGTIVEFRNKESGEHVQRVGGYTKILGNSFSKMYLEYNLTPKLIEDIATASALHDLGKISISDSILNKTGKLTNEEFDIMKRHTIFGCELLENINISWGDDYKKIIWEICRYHHERHDGKGYPEGLVGDEIPISAQLVSVADVYDALTSERAYKRAYSPEKAYNMILNGECGTFSPKLIEAFKSCKEEFVANT